MATTLLLRGSRRVGSMCREAIFNFTLRRGSNTKPWTVSSGLGLARAGAGSERGSRRRVHVRYHIVDARTSDSRSSRIVRDELVGVRKPYLQPAKIKSRIITIQ